jgi:hypothetical protein
MTTIQAEVKRLALLQVDTMKNSNQDKTAKAACEAAAIPNCQSEKSKLYNNCNCNL